MKCKRKPLSFRDSFLNSFNRPNVSNRINLISIIYMLSSIAENVFFSHLVYKNFQCYRQNDKIVLMAAKFVVSNKKKL